MIEALHARLRDHIAAYGSVLVAYSGGVDSGLVLRLATEALGDRALGVLARSPSLAQGEEARAVAVAAGMGARLRVVDTAELARPGYRANGSDRCFYCKTELYGVCAALAAAEGYAATLSGTNADDLGDHRPGLRAAADFGVRAPLAELGLSKADVRSLARHLALPTWDKPAAPCLASRLPYGTAVSVERLAAVDAVEIAVRALGFREVRARHHGDEVRVEVERARVPELRAVSSALAEAARAAGFSRWSIEPEGFRSGRLNDALKIVR